MVNVDEEQDLATRYHVMSIPTLLLLRIGEIADRQVGAKSFGRTCASDREIFVIEGVVS